jgi:hypothetical protein
MRSGVGFPKEKNTRVIAKIKMNAGLPLNNRPKVLPRETKNR